MESLPVLIGFIILVAILIPSILLLILYKKYLRLQKALPDPNSIEHARPGALDEKRGLLAATLAYAVKAPLIVSTVGLALQY